MSAGNETTRRRSNRLNPDLPGIIVDDEAASSDFVVVPFRLRGGAPLPPPPPPPPQVPPQSTPLQRIPTMDIAVQTGLEEQCSNKEWRLAIRTEPNKLSGRREVVRILIVPNMDVTELSKCVLQISNISAGGELVGLFRESDGLFVTLPHILKEEMQNVVWSLSIPQVHVPAPEPWLTGPMIIFLVTASVGYILWFFGTQLMFTLDEWSGRVFEIVVNLPLRELYRYGPSAIGWEGMSLPRICARITYHGDEDFWSRNMEECNRIFATKEEAHLRLIRPMLYICTLVSLFFAMRSLIREWARSRKVPKPNRDMVETFEAFQMIVRQLRKAINERDTRR